MPSILWTNSYLSEISGDLAAIKAAHIDVLFSYLLTPSTSDADMTAYLDALHAAGLQTMLAIYPLGKNVVYTRESKVLTSGELATLAAYIDKWKTHPAVWGWYADDEGTAAYPVSTRQQVYDTIKAHHPAGQVLEVACVLTSGAYSPAVHDVFAMDAGVGGQGYVYRYDDLPAAPWYGCVSKDTGLVTSVANEAAALGSFQASLAALRATLIAAGETQFFVCMQAFRQTAAGTNYQFAMPPADGLSKMFARIQAAGWDQYGAGWFLWKSNDAATMPGENLDGVGESAYSANIIPAMTSNTAPSGVASASSIYSASYPAWNAFDHGAGSGLPWRAAGTTGQLGYQFPSPRVVTRYAIKTATAIAGNSRAPKTWTFQGSADGVNWVTLDAQTNYADTDWATLSGVRRAFDFTNTTAYAYHRLDISASNSPTYLSVGELEMMETVAAYPAQRAELSVIAALPPALFVPAPAPRSQEWTLPVLVVKVAGEDITEIVDMDTLHRSMSERGEASATIDIPVASANEVPVNGLARDAVVEIVVDGAVEWLGQVVAVHKPKPQDLSYVLDCAGGWDTLHHCAPYCKGFVETRYDLFRSKNAGKLDWRDSFVSLETGGQAMALIGEGATVPAGFSVGMYINPLDGMDATLAIRRVTFDLAWSDGTNGALSLAIWSGDDPFDNHWGESIVSDAVMTGSGTVAVDHTMADTTHMRIVELDISSVMGAGVAAADIFIQIRNLRIYIDRLTAPRVDEIVAAIDAEVRPGAPAAYTEAIGAPLTAFMLDPFMTPADGIAVALTKAAVPPLCGIVQNQLIVKNRPTAPPDATRLWTVSEQLTPGLEWGVEVDEEQSVDYVSVAYNVIGDALLPDGTPQIAYHPSAPPNAAARTGLIDGGDLTAAEAAFYAQQGYYYMHALASGPVVIPYVVQDANGNERPVDVIRQWDWVQNVGSLDADTAGPFMVSEVEHQGHIATLTIGAAEAYAYNGPDRMPTKGRYVGAHRVRSRTKKRVSFAKYWAWKHRKDKRKPKMPKRHAKYGTIRGYKWTDVEGRYT